MRNPTPIILQSQHLTLRPVADRDIVPLHRHWTDPDVRRFLWDDQVIPREQVAELVAHSERVFAEAGHGLWAIRVHGSHRLLGCAGYWEFHEPPRLELILSLSPEYWGKGLATEAGTLLLRYAFDELGFDEVLASTDAPNEASLRLVERLGFRRVRREEAGGRDTVFFSREREPRSLP